jgi:hypothetical protein
MIKDVAEVQETTLAACKLFREVEDDAIPLLLDGLYDASTLGAYSSLQIIAALGRSDSISIVQRQQICKGLAEAMRDKRSRRDVYALSSDYFYIDRIRYLGRLQQIMYKVFLQTLGVLGNKENPWESEILK